MKRLWLTILLILATTSSAGATEYKLSFPWTKQEQTNWCWIGVSTNVLKYYGVTVSQCALANLARTNDGWHSADMGTDDCCENATACNKTNSMNVITKLLNKHGVDAANTKYTSADVERIIKEVSAYRPIIFRWGWKKYENGQYVLNGNGHFLAIYGINSDTSMVNYFDPGHNEGLHVIDYQALKDNNSHSWTHTVYINSTPGNNCSDAKPCCSCHEANGCCDGCRPLQASENTTCQEDDNPCKSSGTCQAGQCVGNEAVPDGTFCLPADSNCVTAGTCQNGYCLAKEFKECDNRGPCYSGGYCDSATGKCVEQEKKADGAYCQPTDRCITAGFCQDGICIGREEAAVDCKAASQCYADGQCDAETGRCVPVLRENGTSCISDNRCSLTAVCQDGDCTTTSALECPEKPCQRSGGCLAGTGECVYSNLEDGTPCDTGDPCQEAACVDGACVITNGNCDDSNPCTADQCGPRGCEHTSQADGQSCGYGICGEQICLAGKCIYGNDAFDNTCNDGNPCTNNRCSNERGCYYTTMGDGESCGTGKICQTGQCVNDPNYVPTRGCQNGSPAGWILGLLSLFLLIKRREASR